MRPNRTLLPVGALVALLVGVFVFLYAQTRSHDAAAYFENVELLARIKQLDEEWELEVLKAKIGIVQGQSSVVEARDRLARRVEELRARLADQQGAGGPALPHAAALIQSLKEKDGMVEEFKLHNGLLLEAFKNLPAAMQEVQEAFRRLERAHQPALHSMLHLVDDLYLASVAYDQGEVHETSAELQAELAQLVSGAHYRALPAATRRQVDAFHAHVGLLLGERELANALLNGIVTAPTDQRVDQITRVLNEEQASAAARAQRFRVYLLGFSALLIGLFVYAAVRLARSHALVQSINADLVAANEHLEQRVAERTRELRDAQGELMASARQAGMAEIATNVLHNVGNVLNSVNVSTQLMIGQLRASRVQGLGQAVRMLGEHRATLGDFLSTDPKGRLLPGYLEQLAPALAAEREALAQELAALAKSVDHIKEVIATQQGIAGVSSMKAPASIQQLVEEAVRRAADSLSRHRVGVVRDFAAVPELPLDKARILQVLVNLVGNAKQALEGVSGRLPQIRVGIEWPEPGRLRIEVGDNGRGIPPENLQRIFAHGFTTKPQGHGFGLHGAAIAAREMGGSLQVRSEGLDRGATFTLDIPVPAEGAGVAKPP